MGRRKGIWCDACSCCMRLLHVVLPDPDFGDRSNLPQRVEPVNIQHIPATGAVEALDVSTLREFVRRNKVPLHVVCVCPVREHLGQMPH